SQVPSLRQDSVMRLEPTADPRHVARLALDEDNANVAGGWSLSVFRAGPTALAEVVAALQHDNPEVRLRAVRIIERAKGTDEHLLGALDDPEASVRGAAALALGERGGQQAFEELMRMIVDGDHDTAAADTVAQASSWQDKALSTISALLNDDHVLPAQRARLVQALAEFAGSDTGGCVNCHSHLECPGECSLNRRASSIPECEESKSIESCCASSHGGRRRVFICGRGCCGGVI